VNSSSQKPVFSPVSPSLSCEVSTISTFTITPIGGDGCLTGFYPSPTSHAVVGFRFQARLTQGPAVRATDRRHSLRLGILTMTRSAYVQVRCAVFALWSEHHSGYAQQT
jgi:hypothetical protein